LPSKETIPVLYLYFWGLIIKDMKEENKNPITPLAITDYRDIRKKFGIKEKNRRGHIKGSFEEHKTAQKEGLRYGNTRSFEIPIYLYWRIDFLISYCKGHIFWHIQKLV